MKLTTSIIIATLLMILPATGMSISVSANDESGSMTNKLTITGQGQTEYYSVLQMSGNTGISFKDQGQSTENSTFSLNYETPMIIFGYDFVSINRNTAWMDRINIDGYEIKSIVTSSSVV